MLGHPHHTGEAGSGAQHGQTAHHAGVVEEVSHGSDIGSQQTGVESVSARQHQGIGVEISVQLPVGNERPSESDSSDVGAEEGGSLNHGGGGVGCKPWEMVDVGGDTREDGGHADQGVERSDQLGQVSDLDLLGDGGSNGGPSDGCPDHLGEDLGVGLEDTESGGDTGAHSDDAESVPKSSGGLGRETSESSNAAET